MAKIKEMYNEKGDYKCEKCNSIYWIVDLIPSKKIRCYNCKLDLMLSDLEFDLISRLINYTRMSNLIKLRNDIIDSIRIVRRK